MNQSHISEGDLFAYLDGETLPDLSQALKASSELQKQLDELHHFDAWLQAHFANLGQPDPQDLVDVVSGQATAQQRLRVAAYTRQSERGRREMGTLQGEWAALQKKQKHKLRLPEWIATPLTLAVGLRSTDTQTDVQTSWQRELQEVRRSFQVIELQTEVILNMPPATHERWQIIGYVTQNHQPLSQAKVTVRSEQMRPRPRMTDEMGFFSFRQLPAGDYRLRIYLPDAIVLLPPIEFRNQD